LTFCRLVSLNCVQKLLRFKLMLHLRIIASDNELAQAFLGFSDAASRVVTVGHQWTQRLHEICFG